MTGHELSLLIVDDNEHERNILTRALRKIGVTYPINHASSGSMAISYLKGEGEYEDRILHPYPSHIVTDLNMPNGDGFSVLRYFEKPFNGIKTPIFVITSSQDQDDINRAYLLGASAYFVKPINFNEMIDVMKTFVDLLVKCRLPRLKSESKSLADRIANSQSITNILLSTTAIAI